MIDTHVLSFIKIKDLKLKALCVIGGRWRWKSSRPSYCSATCQGP